MTNFRPLKLKGFADEKINMNQKLKYVSVRVEKEKMLITSIFSFSHNVFKVICYACAMRFAFLLHDCPRLIACV